MIILPLVSAAEFKRPAPACLHAGTARDFATKMLARRSDARVAAFLVLITSLLTALCACACAGQGSNANGTDPDSVRKVIPAGTNDVGSVDLATMQRIYDEVKTPFKYGVVIRGEGGRYVDCPAVFRHGGKWFMTYIAFDGSGYETRLAESTNLLHWQPAGKILTRGSGSWDTEQAAGFIALEDTTWGGSCELKVFDGKYWLSYLGGRLKGYEIPPLSIGLAWTENPTVPKEWTRLAQNPVLTPDQPDARPFEQDTLFKTHIIRDPQSSLGWPFVMFYNARQKGAGIERIGMAVSRDMVHWHRYGREPVIDNGPASGISGDPQVVRIGEAWVMFYFGAFWRPGAFDTFACSRDLVHWTKWTGPDLIKPSEPWDKQYAHKPWVLKHDRVVYHFYCAVGDQGRVIALALSKRLPADTAPFNFNDAKKPTGQAGQSQERKATP